MSSVAVSTCPVCGCKLLDSVLSCPHCHAVGELSRASQQSQSKAASLSAPLWRRFAAALLDCLLASAILFPFAMLLMWTMEAYHAEVGLSELKSRTIMGSAVVLLWIIWFWLYSALGESSWYQATPGKRLLHLKVGDLSGRRLGFQQTSCRFFAKFLSTFVLLGGFFVAALHPQRQSLHDMIAGTLVYRQEP